MTRSRKIIDAAGLHFISARQRSNQTLQLNQPTTTTKPIYETIRIYEQQRRARVSPAQRARERERETKSVVGFAERGRRDARPTLSSPRFSATTHDKTLSRNSLGEPPIGKREQAPRTPNAGALMPRLATSRSVWSAPGLPALWVQQFKARIVSSNSLSSTGVRLHARPLHSRHLRPDVAHGG